MFTEEAFYTITITDNFNNVVTTYFEIDRTPPKLLFFFNENNEPIKNTAFIDDELVKVTNKSFYFASNKDFTTFKVIYEDEQEKEYEPNLVIYTPGKYVVRVTDDLGLTFQSTIIYNNQEPTPTIFFNNEEKLLVNKYDSIYDYKKHLGYVPSVPLRTNKSFTLLELKKIYLEKVTYKIGSGKDATEYMLNYKDDPKDELTFVNENDYSFALTDVFGNVSEFKIVLDKTPPKYKVTGLNKDNKSSSKVTFTWEEYSAVAALFNLTTGKEREIYSDHSVHQEGEYLFTLMDDVGNFVTHKFTIDYFAPEPTIFTNLEAVVKKELFVLNKYKTNKNVSIIIPGEPKFQTFKYFLNEKEMTASEINNYQVSEEGVYTFRYVTSYDAIGSLTFEIDRTPPVYEVMGLIKPGVPRSNSFVSFFWEEKEASGFLRNLNDPDNQVSYTKETKIYANGEYEFTLVDEVGNATEYIFAINNTLLDPTVFTNLKEVVKPEFFSKKIYQTNKNVKLILLPEHRLYLDGKQILEPKEIKNPGTYKLKLENGFDLSTEIEFTIKTEPPVFKAFGLNAFNRSNVYVKFVWKDIKAKGMITNQNGELVKEIQSGDKFYQKGKYIFTITDELDNKSELGFQILSLEPVLTLKDRDGSTITKEYLNEPVYIHKEFDHLRYYVNGIEITKFPYILENDGKYLVASKNEFDEQAIRHVAIKRSIGEIIPSVLETKTNQDISFRFNQDEITLTVRDVIYKTNEPYYYEGTTTFEFSDIYGNKKEYTVTQRRTLPDIYLLVLNENGEETSKLLENDLKLFEPFKIKEEEGIKTYVNSSLSETGYYEESKDYQVTVYDEFGNQREYVFSANLVKSKNTENYRYNKVMLIIFLLFLTTALTIFGLIKLFNFKRNPFTKRKFRKIKETAVLPQNEES